MVLRVKVFFPHLEVLILRDSLALQACAKTSGRHCYSKKLLRQLQRWALVQFLHYHADTVALIASSQILSAISDLGTHHNLFSSMSPFHYIMLFCSSGLASLWCFFNRLPGELKILCFLANMRYIRDGIFTARLHVQGGDIPM